MTLVFAMAVPAGDAQVRGGSHLREPPGFPGHVRATRPDARTRCRQLSEGVPRHSSPGDERQGGPGRAFDDAERGHDQRPNCAH